MPANYGCPVLRQRGQIYQHQAEGLVLRVLLAAPEGQPEHRQGAHVTEVVFSAEGQRHARVHQGFAAVFVFVLALAVAATATPVAAATADATAVDSPGRGALIVPDDVLTIAAGCNLVMGIFFWCRGLFCRGAVGRRVVSVGDGS